jgi:hypothetical protein
VSLAQQQTKDFGNHMILEKSKLHWLKFLFGPGVIWLNRFPVSTT